MTSPGGSQPLTSIILEAQGLGRIVDGHSLVADVSIRVSRGEVLAIVGPSGSGKSSLLRLLNRLDEATSGTVLLEGVDFRQIPPRDLRRKVGMVTQRAFLFPGTVAENIEFGPRQRGENLSAMNIGSILTKVGLPEYAARDVANLSGGEAQRVSFARALANSPVVILLDEPTSALDEEAKAGIEALIREIISTSNLTCIVVTHDVSQALRLATRALVLESGRVTRIGAANEVLNA